VGAGACSGEKAVETSNGDSDATPRVWRHPAGTDDSLSLAGYNGREVIVSHDDDGNAIVVWVQSVAGVNRLYMSEYSSATQTWEHPQSADDFFSIPGVSSTADALVHGPNGNALLLWRVSNGGVYSLVKSEYDAASDTWTHATAIADNFSMDGVQAQGAQGCFDDAGNAFVTWNGIDGAWGVFMSRYDAATETWTHPSTFDDAISLPGTDAQSPELSCAGNGDAMVVWGQNSHSYLSHYRAATQTWNHPATADDFFSVDTASYSYSAYANVSLDDDGNAIVMWRQGGILLGSYDASADTWTLPASTADAITTNGARQSSMSIARADNGDLLLVWSEPDSNNTSQVFMSHYDAGAGIWTHPADIDDNISPDGSAAQNPRAAFDGAGNALVVWEQEDQDGFGALLKSHYAAATDTWTHPTSYDDTFSFPGHAVMRHALSYAKTGDAIVAWWDWASDGSERIYMSEYR
jgi:hypothetical protein